MHHQTHQSSAKPTKSKPKNTKKFHNKPTINQTHNKPQFLSQTRNQHWRNQDSMPFVVVVVNDDGLRLRFWPWMPHGEKKKKKRERGERDKASGAQQLTPEMVNGDLRKEQQSLSLSMDVQAMRERERERESHEL